jgi:hypothetical protein
MHLMSNPFFSFDLQYDQQIKPRKQQDLLPLNQFPNERDLWLYCTLAIRLQ